MLLIVDSLKKNNFTEAQNHLSSAFNFVGDDRLNPAILETLKQFIFVFKEKKLLQDKKSFGNLTLIAETFQKCYLNDPKTDKFFSNVINNYNQIDYTRYLYFYFSIINLIERLKCIWPDLLYFIFRLRESTKYFLNSQSWVHFVDVVDKDIFR